MRFFAAALRRIRRDADLVLCSSEATRRDAVDAGIAPDRLRVVPLGVRRPVVTPGAVAEVRRKFAITGRYVLHLGTDEPRKNAAALARVVPRLPDDVSVVFAGGAGWGATSRRAATHPGRILNVGFVTEAEKSALLAGADVFGFPSVWEGFGLPVLEAMAQGTPVVTSQDTAMAEIVADAGLLVDPGDDEALTSALVQVLDDDHLARRLARAGTERADQFTWERTGAAVLDAYREVLGR